MFEQVMYLRVLYCLCFVNEILEDIQEDQSREEGDPDLELEEDIYILDNREKHWKDVIVENNEYRGKVHDLKWEVYMKQKEFIKRDFSVVFTHTKGGNVVWTCVEDNIIEEN